MTKKELAISIRNETGYPISEIKAIIEAMTTAIGNSLIHGEQVKIQDFGTFKTKEVSSKGFINISTGEYETTRSYTRISFIPCTELKEALK